MRKLPGDECAAYQGFLNTYKITEGWIKSAVPPNMRSGFSKRMQLKIEGIRIREQQKMIESDPVSRDQTFQSQINSQNQYLQAMFQEQEVSFKAKAETKKKKANKEKNDDFSGIRAGIIQLEDVLRGSLSEDMASSSDIDQSTRSDDLEKIYRVYIDTLGEDQFKAFISYSLSTFILCNDVNAAYRYACVFSILLREKNIEIEDMKLRYQMAYVKALSNDYADFEALQHEKLERKARAESKAAARAVERLAVSAEVEIRKSLNEQRTEQLRAEVLARAQQKRREQAAILDSKKVTETVVASQGSSSKSKAEKKQSHVERNEERAKQIAEEIVAKAVAEEKQAAEALVAAAKEELPAENAVVQLPLGDLYGLTGTPQDVDMSIESNEWQFTREDLYLYFAALGCEQRPNNGSHAIFQLPESHLFYKDGVLVSVFFDEGGSLTLPPWDKNYVPHYLKKQINGARDKLREAYMSSQAK